MVLIGRRAHARPGGAFLFFLVLRSVRNKDAALAGTAEFTVVPNLRREKFEPLCTLFPGVVSLGGCLLGVASRRGDACYMRVLRRVLEAHSVSLPRIVSLLYLIREY